MFNLTRNLVNGNSEERIRFPPSPNPTFLMKTRRQSLIEKSVESAVEGSPARFREAAARHTSSQSLLRTLAGDANRTVRRVAAHSPQMPDKTLDRYERAGSTPDLLRAQRETGTLSESDVERLLQTPWGWILVAQHPDTPERLHDRMTQPHQ